MKAMLRHWRDYQFKNDAAFSIQERLLFDIRKYLQVLTAVYTVLAVVVFVGLSVIFWRVSTYDLVKVENMNQLNSNLQSIMRNANAMSTLAVPIVGNAQFMTNGMAAAMASALNASEAASTAAEARLASGRTLLGDELPVTAQDLVREDYKMRRMAYNQVHSVLSKANDFNVTALNGLVSGMGDTLHWVVSGVNYTTLLRVYDESRTDLETVGRFVSLLTLMSGMAASALNATWVSPLKLVDLYSQQLAGAGALRAPPPRGSASCS